MIHPTLRRRLVLMTLCLLAAGPALADRITLESLGTLGPEVGGFELRLDFEQPIQPSLELEALDSVGFFADDWSLRLSPDSGPAFLLQPGDLPGVRASATYTGFIQGVGPSRTELSLRLADQDRVIADLLFAQEGLNATFFNADPVTGSTLEARDFDFVAGFTLAPDAGLSAADTARVIGATVSASQMLGAPEPGPAFPPSAVPSPAALGGGLLLLSYLAARRREA